jgi:hypothetical protein
MFPMQVLKDALVAHQLIYEVKLVAASSKAPGQDIRDRVLVATAPAEELHNVPMAKVAQDHDLVDIVRPHNGPRQLLHRHFLLIPQLSTVHLSEGASAELRSEVVGCLSQFAVLEFPWS